MLPFKSYGPVDRTERKALIIAGVCCCVFIGFLSLVHPREPKKRRVSTTTNIAVPTPMRETRLFAPEPPPMNATDIYRVVPESFKGVDFANRSYGPYLSPNTSAIDLTLTDSELQLPNNSGWFSLKDVYYKDLTADGRSEAIVRLSHVQCGGTCDGGRDLFYIYTRRNGQLKTLWQYETGSYAYGCGLKSFTLSGKQIVMELFGRCPKPGIEDPRTSKFHTSGLTFVLFDFNGQRYTQELIEFFDSPTTDVKNYEPPIYIY